MNAENKIVVVTLILCATAGFCDALTYSAANGLFSAHVTGNFILFATNLANAKEHDPWIKLLTFPVFVVTVMAAGWAGSKSSNKYLLLLAEAVVLTITGIAATIAALKGLPRDSSMVYFFAMMIVCAMGIQNAFGKIFTAATFAPTTMMTGNVTQWALDLKNIWSSGLTDQAAIKSFRRLTLTIVAFLTGCLAGSLAGRIAGLGAVGLAGVAMFVCYRLARIQFNR